MLQEYIKVDERYSVGMKAPNVDVAACGLDCESCSLRTFQFDSEAAAEALSWYRDKGWLEETEGVTEAIQKRLYCKGCHGPRNEHWSPDCWILACCVDGKHLNHCAECDQFPCENLTNWARKSKRYQEAVSNLQKRR